MLGGWLGKWAGAGKVAPVGGGGVGAAEAEGAVAVAELGHGFWICFLFRFVGRFGNSVLRGGIKNKSRKFEITVS